MRMTDEQKVKCPICRGFAIYTKNDGVIVCHSDSILKVLSDKPFHKFLFGYSVYAEQQLEKR